VKRAFDDRFVDESETLFLDAAINACDWTDAFGAVGDAVGSRGTALFTIIGRGPMVLPSEQVAEAADRYVKEGWYLQDVRYRGIPHLKTRGIIVDQDIVSSSDMERLPFYTEFLKRSGFQWFAGLKIDAGDDMWCLTLQRNAAMGAFDAAEQARLLRLSSIISRGATLANRLNSARLDGAVDASEALNCACLFVNRFGKVVRLNAKAEAMLGRRFQLRDGRISFPRSPAKALQQHIEAAIWPDLPADSNALQPVVVRENAARPLVFQAIRLRGQVCSFFSPAVAMITITDLAAPTVGNIDHLRTVLKFSAAEARLALALLERFSLVDAARALDVSHETLRSQLKGMLAKTETRNQAELIDLIRRLGAAG